MTNFLFHYRRFHSRSSRDVSSNFASNVTRSILHNLRTIPVFTITVHTMLYGRDLAFLVLYVSTRVSLIKTDFSAFLLHFISRFNSVISNCQLLTIKIKVVVGKLCHPWLSEFWQIFCVHKHNTGFVHCPAERLPDFCKMYIYLLYRIFGTFYLINTNVVTKNNCQGIAYLAFILDPRATYFWILLNTWFTSRNVALQYLFFI